MPDHHPAARRSIAAALIASSCLLALASGAGAQATRPWRIEAALGAFVHPYDSDPGDNDAGPFAELSVSREFGANFRMTASLSGSRISNAQTISTVYKLREDWVFLVAGPEVDVPLSRVHLSVALQTGGFWDRRVSTGPTPPPEVYVNSRHWTRGAVLVPGMQLRVPLTTRLSAIGSASAYIINWLDSPRRGEEFGIGLAFQP